MASDKSVEGKYFMDVHPRPSIRRANAEEKDDLMIKPRSNQTSSIFLAKSLKAAPFLASDATCVSKTDPPELKKTTCSPQIKTRTGGLVQREEETSTVKLGISSQGHHKMPVSTRSQAHELKRDVTNSKETNAERRKTDTSYVQKPIPQMKMCQKDSEDSSYSLEEDSEEDSNEFAKGDAHCHRIPDLQVREIKSRRRNPNKEYNQEKEAPQTIIKQAGFKQQEFRQSGTWKVKGICILLFMVVLYGLGQYGYQNKTPVTNGKDSIHIFQMKFEELKSTFTNQRNELWRRTKILLEKKLKTSVHTGPVSMILTSGHNAQKTLHCLADYLARVYSSSLNASFSQIDGSNMSSLDSDQVKLQIDGDLTIGFESNKTFVVIRNLEELPPGSTLIFYKYCDHENAAFKSAALIFTVLLQEDSLDPAMTLDTVEEKVRDYLQERFLTFNQPAAFDRMDSDKLGGLWSRISHLVLPVAEEMHIEKHGCDLYNTK
ncbi:torsin-1A-interacting protein 2-like isoform X2 [Erpetoichthys calabaricus]|uniref:Torsin-1A-interacting protein 2-like n=1 Tax=Erpetoichthys calabaricus TaxID=27687 RepID=A0A8C4RZR3_ERPCA|nr:torsin-1A-interacting protein 2-like isoform X2 [Erpetoichthys calabaricus]